MKGAIEDSVVLFVKNKPESDAAQLNGAFRPI